jgi:hypothetical protein
VIAGANSVQPPATSTAANVGTSRGKTAVGVLAVERSGAAHARRAASSAVAAVRRVASLKGDTFSGLTYISSRTRMS